MGKYRVSFIQYHTYDVEAETESEAEDKAWKEFQSDMRGSVASTQFDDVEIEDWSEKDAD